MGSTGLGRRDSMRMLAGAAAASVLGGRGTAQTRDPLAALEGLKLPKELIALLPKQELDLLRTIAALLRIERDAEARRLPPTALAFQSRTKLPATSDGFYTAAVPRLVALIDRAETTDVELGDRAGAILADINAMQHEIPDALKPPLEMSKAHDFESLKAEYATLFAGLEVRPEFAEAADWQARAVRQFRPRYELVGKEVGVPWFFIGAIHGLEASFNFRAHLHNGDFPLAQRTRQVPSGRPLVWQPPSDWGSSAKDALRLLGFAGKTDWTLERTLYRLEAFNGFGYRRRGVPTPYLWCYSTHYDRGKFVADGRWNPDARSQQCGAAVALKLLRDAGEIDFSKV